MKVPALASFSQAEVDLGTKVFRYLAGNMDFVTPNQMIGFLRLSGLENQQLSVVWEKATGATKKNFHLVDTLYLLRMLALVQQGKGLDDVILLDTSFPHSPDLSFCPLDDASDIDIIDDSQSSTPTSSLCVKGSLSGESANQIRDPSQLQTVYPSLDLSISRCNVVNKIPTVDPSQTENTSSIMHVALDSSVSSDPVDVNTSVTITDTIVPVSITGLLSGPSTAPITCPDKYGDLGSTDSKDKEPREELVDPAKLIPQLTSSPVAANPAPVSAIAPSTAPATSLQHPTVLTSFVDITKHFQEALGSTQEMVHKILDISNPLVGLTLVSPEQISTLKKQLSEMSKKLIDQLNTVSEQSFTSSLTSCLKGLESLSNALSMLITKERNVMKITSEILSYLDNTEDSEGALSSGAGTGTGTGTGGEHQMTHGQKQIHPETSETEERQDQESTDTDFSNMQSKPQNAKSMHSSQSENILSSSISTLPATSLGSSSATYQGGEQLPPARALPVKKKNLIRLVQDAREVMNSVRTVEASYVRAREANRMYKNLSDTLASILQTEEETNTNLKEQQKKLEQKAEEKAALLDKQVEQIKSLFAEQTAMFNSMVSVLMSSPAFKNQLNQFTIELADRAVAEVYNSLHSMSKLSGISNEFKRVVQNKLTSSPNIAAAQLSLETPSFGDRGQQRPQRNSYNTISHSTSTTRSELVAQQAIRSIVRDELRSLKGELLEEIRAMIMSTFVGQQGHVNGTSVGSSASAGQITRTEPSTTVLVTDIPQHSFQHGNIAVTPSISTDERMKPWTSQFGSSAPITQL